MGSRTGDLLFVPMRERRNPIKGFASGVDLDPTTVKHVEHIIAGVAAAEGSSGSDSGTSVATARAICSTVSANNNNKSSVASLQAWLPRIIDMAVRRIVVACMATTTGESDREDSNQEVVHSSLLRLSSLTTEAQLYADFLFSLMNEVRSITMDEAEENHNSSAASQSNNNYSEYSDNNSYSEYPSAHQLLNHEMRGLYQSALVTPLPGGGGIKILKCEALAKLVLLQVICQYEGMLVRPVDLVREVVTDMFPKASGGPPLPERHESCSGRRQLEELCNRLVRNGGTQFCSGGLFVRPNGTVGVVQKKVVAKVDLFPESPPSGGASHLQDSCRTGTTTLWMFDSKHQQLEYLCNLLASTGEAFFAAELDEEFEELVSLAKECQTPSSEGGHHPGRDLESAQKALQEVLTRHQEEKKENQEWLTSDEGGMVNHRHKQAFVTLMSRYGGGTSKAAANNSSPDEASGFAGGGCGGGGFPVALAFNMWKSMRHVVQPQDRETFTFPENYTISNFDLTYSCHSGMLCHGQGGRDLQQELETQEMMRLAKIRHNDEKEGAGNMKVPSARGWKDQGGEGEEPTMIQELNSFQPPRRHHPIVTLFHEVLRDLLHGPVAHIDIFKVVLEQLVRHEAKVRALQLGADGEEGENGKGARNTRHAEEDAMDVFGTVSLSMIIKQVLWIGGSALKLLPWLLNTFSASHDNELLDAFNGVVAEDSIPTLKIQDFYVDATDAWSGTSLSDLDLVHMFKEFKDDTEGLLTHLMKKPTPGRIASVFYLFKAITRAQEKRLKNTQRIGGGGPKYLDELAVSDPEHYLVAERNQEVKGMVFTRMFLQPWPLAERQTQNEFLRFLMRRYKMEVDAPLNETLRVSLACAEWVNIRSLPDSSSTNVALLNMFGSKTLLESTVTSSSMCYGARVQLLNLWLEEAAMEHPAYLDNAKAYLPDGSDNQFRYYGSYYFKYRPYAVNPRYLLGGAEERGFRTDDDMICRLRTLRRRQKLCGWDRKLWNSLPCSAKGMNRRDDCGDRSSVAPDAQHGATPAPENKWSLVHLLAAQGAADMLYPVLEYFGANPNLRDPVYGNTPLHEAVSHLHDPTEPGSTRGDAVNPKYQSVITLLEKYGADWHLANKVGETPNEMTALNFTFERGEVAHDGFASLELWRRKRWLSYQIMVEENPFRDDEAGYQWFRSIQDQDLGITFEMRKGKLQARLPWKGNQHLNPKLKSEYWFTRLSRKGGWVRGKRHDDADWTEEYDPDQKWVAGRAGGSRKGAKFSETMARGQYTSDTSRNWMMDAWWM